MLGVWKKPSLKSAPCSTNIVPADLYPAYAERESVVSQSKAELPLYSAEATSRQGWFGYFSIVMVWFIFQKVTDSLIFFNILKIAKNLSMMFL